MDTSEEYAKMYDAAKDIHINCEKYRDGFYMIKTPTKFQWVPRQEHLQELILNHGSTGYSNDGIFMHLSMFSVEMHMESSTMELVWLAFVMKEKCGKEWNGEEWI